MIAGGKISETFRIDIIPTLSRHTLTWLLLKLKTDVLPVFLMHTPLYSNIN